MKTTDVSDDYKNFPIGTLVKFRYEKFEFTSVVLSSVIYIDYDTLAAYYIKIFNCNVNFTWLRFPEDGDVNIVWPSSIPSYYIKVDEVKIFRPKM